MENQISNDRIISFHRNKLDYVNPDINTLRFAYEDRRYEKMSKDLLLADDILKLKTLEEINEDFVRGDKINLGLLSSCILDILAGPKLLQHKNDEIRENASRAITKISSLELGRKRIIEQDYVLQIVQLIDDNRANIRRNAYVVQLNLAEFREGQEHIVNKHEKIIQLLVDKLIEEKDISILKLTLELIKSLLQCEGATKKILKTQVIKRLTQLIVNKDVNIRTLSILNLAQISFDEDGKSQVIFEKCVIPLCERLSESESSVKEAASIALASLAQKNDAKFQILENNFFQIIMNLLEDPSEQTKVNIIQLISSISEHPEGRKMAKTCLNKLRDLKSNNQNSFLIPYINYTIEVIEWTP